MRSVGNSTECINFIIYSAFWYKFYMWCDQAKWVGTRKYWFGERAKQSPFVFYCFDNLSIGHNFVMTCPILMGVSAKRSSSNGE